jgi:hypothetical protein
MTHDQLQKSCFDFLWNYYPETRRCCWHTPNEQRPFPGESKKAHMIRLTQAKSIGVLKGVVDLVLYFKGVLYLFDIKVGNDRLSEDQLKFIAAIEAQGGKFFEVNDFESFKKFCELNIK